MEKEYLLTVVEQSGGIELEHSVIVTPYPERIKSFYKTYNRSYNSVRIYERSVTDWKRTELEKITSPE